MTPDRIAVPGLVFLLVAAVLAATGTALALAAVPLGLGIALLVCAAHEALVELGSER